MRPTLTRVDLGRIEYASALARQDALVEQRAAGLTGDLLLLLEHDPVFTMGRRGKQEHVLALQDERGLPIPLHHVTRGGDVTYHGPGQLVGYPIVDLGALAGEEPRRPGAVRGDVVDYLRRLEQALIDACAAFGVEAGRNAPFTGIWSNGEKLASIGVAVRKDVTHHGFALNVTTDLTYFDRIVPCGLRWARMTSLERILGDAPPMEAVRDAVATALAAALGRTLARGSENP